MSEAGLKDPVLSVFVDDIKIMAPKGSGMFGGVKVELTAAFSMVDIEPISFYLELRVDQDQKQKTIKLPTCIHWESSSKIPPWQSQPSQHAKERIRTPHPTHRRRSLTLQEREISRNDGVNNVLNGRNQNRHRLWLPCWLAALQRIQATSTPRQSRIFPSISKARRIEE